MLVDQPFCREIHAAHIEGWVDGYDDGTFRPTNTVSRQAAAAMLWAAANVGDGELPEPRNDLHPSGCTDVPDDHPFCESIDAVAALDISTGYPDGSFHPAEQVTRQAFVAFLGRTMHAPH